MSENSVSPESKSPGQDLINAVFVEMRKLDQEGATPDVSAIKTHLMDILDIDGMTAVKAFAELRDEASRHTLSGWLKEQNNAPETADRNAVIKLLRATWEYAFRAEEDDRKLRELQDRREEGPRYREQVEAQKRGSRRGHPFD